MSEVTDDFLAHYGVVGMKWGKRSGGGGGDKSAMKAKRKEIRKEAYGNAKADFKAHKGRTIGGSVAATLLLGPAGTSTVVGAQLARSAGYGKGKSLAIGLLGGAPGGILATELKVRKIAREED